MLSYCTLYPKSCALCATVLTVQELRDDVAVSSCDLGNQSVLHAVRVLRKPDDQEVRRIRK